MNALGGNRAALTAMYPDLDHWLAVHDVVNATGVFDGPLSKRIGITARGVLP